MGCRPTRFPVVAIDSCQKTLDDLRDLFRVRDLDFDSTHKAFSISTAPYRFVFSASEFTVFLFIVCLLMFSAIRENKDSMDEYLKENNVILVHKSNTFPLNQLRIF